jgi:CBS domain-containing protein
MSIGIVTVPDTLPGREVAQLMLERGVKRVPVMHDGKMAGIISRSDLVRALAEALEKKPIEPASERHSIDEALRHGREEALHKVPKLQ